MNIKQNRILILTSAVLIGMASTGWLVAGQMTGPVVQATSSAPGTMPAADYRPPPWQVAPAEIPAQADSMVRTLHEIARAVTCMVDGEQVKSVLTSRAAEKAFAIDPRDKYAGSDNWDYNHEPFRTTKQTLARAACLAPGLVGCTLYSPSAVKPERWHVLMNTLVSGKQMMVDGDSISSAPDAEVLQVFHTGNRVEVRKKTGEVSVLTPVYDSLGQIVAVVEVFAREGLYNQVRK